MLKNNFKVLVPIVPICYLLVSALTGCIPLLKNHKQTPEVITSRPVSAPVEQKEVFTPNLKPNEYKKEIARLQRIIVSQPERSEKAKAHFQLARLYSSYKNPEKNYLAIENLIKQFSCQQFKFSSIF